MTMECAADIVKQLGESGSAATHETFAVFAEYLDLTPSQEEFFAQLCGFNTTSSNQTPKGENPS